MPLAHPTPGTTFKCPHCQSKCLFTSRQAEWNHKAGNDRIPTDFKLQIVGCQGCGFPVLSLVVMGPNDKIPWTVIYPIGPTRKLAPKEVRDADPDLAADYDDAVKCENLSLTAAMLMLGRCLDAILDGKCGTNPDATLGPKIDSAVANNKIPEILKRPLSEAFRHARNMAGHRWGNRDGETLRIDANILNGRFSIIDALLEHFYVYPATMQSFIGSVTNIEQQRV